MKRQFGYTKVCYRGLVKNAAQVLTLFALSHLWMARRRLLPAAGELCPQGGKLRPTVLETARNRWMRQFRCRQAEITASEQIVQTFLSGLPKRG